MYVAVESCKFRRARLAQHVLRAYLRQLMGACMVYNRKKLILQGTFWGGLLLTLTALDQRVWLPSHALCNDSYVICHTIFFKID